MTQQLLMAYLLIGGCLGLLKGREMGCLGTIGMMVCWPALAVAGLIWLCYGLYVRWFDGSRTMNKEE